MLISYIKPNIIIFILNLKNLKTSIWSEYSLQKFDKSAVFFWFQHLLFHYFIISFFLIPLKIYLFLDYTVGLDMYEFEDAAYPEATMLIKENASSAASISEEVSEVIYSSSVRCWCTSNLFGNDNFHKFSML